LFLAALALFVAASAIVTLSREIRKPPQPAEV
jgi:hypothetical protein